MRNMLAYAKFACSKRHWKTCTAQHVRPLRRRTVKLRPDGKHKPHLRQTLQQTERNSTRATSHFQACTLLACSHSSLLQIPEHEFNQLLHQQTEKTPLWLYIWSTISLYIVLFFFLLLSNLSFRPWYEHRRSHLQRQISEVPLLNHILHRHSTKNTHIY